MKHHLNLTTVNLFYPLHEPSYVRTCILHVKVNPGVILHQWTIHNKTSSHILSVSYMNRQQGILLQLGKLHFSQSSCFDLLPVVSNYVYLFYTLSLVALLTWFWVTQTQLCAPQCDYLYHTNYTTNNALSFRKLFTMGQRIFVCWSLW